MVSSRSALLIFSCLTAICFSRQADAQIREWFESWFADDEAVETASPAVESNCPETVAFFNDAQRFPMSCGAVAPPDIPAPSNSLSIYEGVWDVRLEGENGVTELVGVLSKGMSIVGQREADSAWSFFGSWSAAYDSGEMPFLKNLSGNVQSISPGALQINIGRYEIKVHPNGPSSLIGRWTLYDEKGMAVWNKRPKTEITEVFFHSNRSDEEGNPIVSRVRPGDVGRLEFHHPVSCGYGQMRGNCPTVYVTVHGWPIGAPHEVWVDPLSHLEYSEARFIYKDGESTPTANYSMGWSIVARGLIDHMRLRYVVWDGITPGKQVLWIDGTPFPFDIVIHGYPEPPEPELPPTMISMSVVGRDGDELADLTEGVPFRVIAEFDGDHPDPWTTASLKAAAGAGREVTLWRTNDLRLFESELLTVTPTLSENTIGESP